MNSTLSNILTLVIGTIAITGCESDKIENNSESTLVTEFLTEISSLENIEGENPISLFEANAKIEANEIIDISKDNISEFLIKAKTFKHCVIISGNHTIITVIDYDNCKQSASWGACMPFTEGYIKKGKLEHQEDYMNNIVGLPDSQKRTAYLFN
ncbi:MAG: hypothetical protein QMB65_11525 [Vicingaceae bacterium]|jgi:hypothetical protein